MKPPGKILSLAVVTFFSVNATFSQLTSENSSELVMSMSQRSLVMPGYLTELKALIAKQAFDFWKEGKTEPYVSHLNVYSALHQANKYLNEDSTSTAIYNQIGFHSNKVTALQFGKEPNVYYSASADGTILRWNLADKDAIPETIFESDKIIRSIDISQDGSLLLASFYQTGLAVISLRPSLKGDFETIFDPEPIQAAIFLPDERKYLSVNSDGLLKIKGFSSKTEEVGKTTQQVNDLIVDRQDGTIYAGTASGTLEAWEKPYAVNENDIDGIIDELEKQSYFGYELGSYAINCMDISPNGKLLAVGRERGDVILWDMEGKGIYRVISSHQSAITDIQFNPNNRLLLTTSRDKTARIWDLQDSRKLPIILDDHNDWIFAGSFDQSGKSVITGSGDQLIRKWPVDPQVLADRICSLLTRNMSEDEWEEFVGLGIRYEETCD